MTTRTTDTTFEHEQALLARTGERSMSAAVVYIYDKPGVAETDSKTFEDVLAAQRWVRDEKPRVAYVVSSVMGLPPAIRIWTYYKGQHMPHEEDFRLRQFTAALATQEKDT